MICPQKEAFAEELLVCHGMGQADNDRRVWCYKGSEGVHNPD
jgi:hypothetical protein